MGALRRAAPDMEPDKELGKRPDLDKPIKESIEEPEGVSWAASLTVVVALVYWPPQVLFLATAATTATGTRAVAAGQSSEVQEERRLQTQQQLLPHQHL